MHTPRIHLNPCIWKSLLSSSVLSALLVSFWVFPEWNKSALAQVVPDNTLPNGSIVPANCTDCPIDGGTTVGRNLFHSFEEFSIPNNGSATFNNAAIIERIISRVTGQSASRINGLLEANGTADVFLINPNGIVFGENATLNVGGSFIATTADSLIFSDGAEFSATNPDAPLLTVNVPVGLQFGNSPGAIQVQSAELIGTPESTLALIGGDITMSGGRLDVVRGRIELGSVAGDNLVNIQAGDRPLTVSYDDVSNFQDIQLSNAAVVEVEGIQSGDIQVQGRRIRLTEGSQIVSSATAFGGAGEVTIRGSEQITLVRNAENITGIFNEVDGNATGQSSGSLTIETPTLVLSGGAQIATNTFGTGRGAALNVNAADIELSGTFEDQPTGIFSASRQNATGRGGIITIDTEQLTLREGAQISGSTFGAGDSGELTIRATERVDVIGRSPQNLLIASGLFSSVERDATGNAGSLSITTPQLVISGGAQVSTVARNSGQGGNLNINTSDFVLLSGTAPIERDDNISGILVSAERGATNDAGQLTLTTGTLTIEDGARISADNFGSGLGGSASITADRLLLQDNGQIRAASFAEGPTAGGPAGSLDITAPTVDVLSGSQITVSSETTRPGNLIIRADDIRLQQGEISAVSEETATGQRGGTITVETERLDLSDGAEISVSTFGEANSGNLTVTATEQIDIVGPSGLFAISGETATGRGGTITVGTERLNVSDGGRISVSTFGAGDSGNLVVTATERVELSGRSPQTQDIASGLFSSVEQNATGNGGRLSISTPQLVILDGAQISTVARNSGRGGNLIVTASDSVLLSGTDPTNRDTNVSGILVAAEPGATNEAGRLRLTTDSLTVENGARISADNFGSGMGGSAFLNVEQLTLRDNGQIRAASFDEGPTAGGPAGSIDITARTVELSNGSEITVSSELSQAGNLIIQAEDIRLQQSELTAETRETARGTSGANIELRGLELLLLSDSSLISARAFDDADGGNVTIDARAGFITAPPNQDSDIIANAVEGRGGNIDIVTQGIFGLEERRAIPGNGTNDIDASSEFGLAGTVTITRIEVDPSRGLAELPGTVVDASRLIAQGCSNTAIAQQPSEFIVTGRGGLPPNPDGQLDREWILTGWAIPETRVAANLLQSISPPINTPQERHEPVIEAQGWTKQSDGTIQLWAQTTISPTVLAEGMSCQAMNS